MVHLCNAPFFAWNVCDPSNSLLATPQMSPLASKMNSPSPMPNGCMICGALLMGEKSLPLLLVNSRRSTESLL